MKAVILAAVVALSGSFALADSGAMDQRDRESGPAPGTHIVCTEGTTQVFSEPRANGLDGMISVVRTCHDGRWYPKAKAVTPRRCIEGKTAFFTEFNNINDRSRTVTYVCHNGKYVRAY
ncbi:MAG TPA: hypothetical protein PL182_03075 [Pseudobdellovibrionaceae bacterium]|nr:hypothetical protein [Pseudobdellovibrionaceae bacterium]